MLFVLSEFKHAITLLLVTRGALLAGDTGDN